MARHLVILLFIGAMVAGCAGTGYNTQKGAAIGAGIGALAGQAIGHDTEATLIGTAAGTLLGAIAGNAVDQQAAYSQLYRQRVRAYPPPAYAMSADESPPGEWIEVRGRWVGGRWVPAHRVWVPVNP
ncbi:MAG: glycine zipper 2TM domain-containing protein [Deltaproteobacteria bacterium]|nr:glycine zipper 2TM domain-containing protein [Deltaproteobacteria bacterium]